VPVQHKPCPHGPPPLAQVVDWARRTWQASRVAELPYVPDPDNWMDRQIHRIGKHPRWALALAVLGVAGATWAIGWGPTHPGISAGQKTQITDGWVLGVLIVSLVLAIVPLLCVGLSRSEMINTNRRSQRVARLSQSLSEALQVIEAIKWEVEEGEKVLQRLEKDTQTTKALAELSQTEADAVRSVVASAVRRERLPNLGIALISAIVGGVVGLVIGHLWR
jgi:hypothetical protein